MQVAGAVPASRAIIARPLDVRVRPSRANRAFVHRSRRTFRASGSDAPEPHQSWRVRQVYGDGKVLLDQLREVADLLADGFNASGRSSKDLLNGLVQKVRWSGGDFICLVADDGDVDDLDDNKIINKMVGACDLTLLPAGGAKKSKEGLVADVPEQLDLDSNDTFLYLTGMVVPKKNRRKGIGDALLSECESIAKKIKTKKPKCIALHVSKTNDAAIGLYQKAGYAAIGDIDDGTGAGDAIQSDDKKEEGLFASFPLNFPGGSDTFSFGKKPATRNEMLMVKWLTEEEKGEE